MPTMSMSPEVQAYGQLPSSEQATEMFKQRFSEMAYNVLMAKFPELAAQVVTFKLIETDVENGKGVGAFVLLLDDKTIYVPVVMIDSQLKPFDMFYFKDLNIFLPLAPEWLDEVSKSSLTNMGEPQKMPDGVARDMSIRDLVVPPVMPEGRIGLAADLSQMFKNAAATSYDVKPRFLEFVRNAPLVVLDGIKLAFERNQSFGKKVASFYGKKALLDAFNDGYSRTIKTAAEKPASALKIYTHDTYRPDEVKAQFGIKVASEIFKSIVTNGVAGVDTRPAVKNTVVKVESPVALSPATTTGFYNLYFPDKQKVLCFVTPTVEGSILVLYADGSKAWSVDRHSNYGDGFCMCSPSGSPCEILGEPVLDDSIVKNTAVYKALENQTSGSPKLNSYNVALLLTAQGHIQATCPRKFYKVVEHSDGTKVYDNSVYIDSDDSRRKIMGGSNNTHYPKNTSWFSVPDPYESKQPIVSDPQTITRWFDRYLTDKGGAQAMNIKSAGVAQWWVDGSHAAYMPVAVVKVASKYDISLEDAARALEDAQNYGRCTLRCMPKGFAKKAQGEEQMQQQQQQQPAPPQDPSQYAPQDETMMGQMGMPMAPNGAQMSMSATDLAIAETVQSLQQENQLRMQQIQDQMQQQQQSMQQEADSNQKLIEVLTRIQERASMISQATGGMVPPEAMESPLAAGQMIAPTPEPQPEPPPMPVMQEEPMSAEMVAGQINPELAEQAGDFQDAGMFDTSVLAVMAAAPLLQEIVSTYVPNLEKALDNLGRIQLTLWMKESETKEAIGNDAFILLEDKLRSVFRGLGEIVLQINRNAVNSQADIASIQGQRMLGDQQ